VTVEAAEPRLTDLLTKIDELSDLFRRRLLDDRDKKVLLQQLSERAEWAERHREAALLRPLASQLALVIDRIDASAPQSPIISSFAEEIIDILGHYGITEVPDSGSVQPLMHEIVAVEGTRSEGGTLVIERRVRRGFLLDSVVIRAAQVVVRSVPSGIDTSDEVAPSE
jgi:molecular chaperone GrpE (heat shock protein)